MAPWLDCAPSHSLPDGGAGNRRANPIRQSVKRLPNSRQMDQRVSPAASGSSISGYSRLTLAGRLPTTKPIYPNSAPTIASTSPSCPVPALPPCPSVDPGLYGDGRARVFSPPLRSSTLRIRWPHAAVPGSERRPPACPAPPPVRGLSSQSLPGSGLTPDLLPLFCSGSVLMRPNYATVHIMDFPVYLPGSISLLLHLRQEPVPQPPLAPPVEPGGYRRPGTVSLRQVPPKERRCAAPTRCR